MSHLPIPVGINAIGNRRRSVAFAQPAYLRDCRVESYFSASVSSKSAAKLRLQDSGTFASLFNFTVCCIEPFCPFRRRFFRSTILGRKMTRCISSKQFFRATLLASLLAATPALATDCQSLLGPFNRAIDEAREPDAQALIDQIAASAECGQYQTAAQYRLAALRLSAAQILMARGRPVAEYERLLTAAETPEVLWQASATLGEVRYGARRFAEAAQAYDRAIAIVNNETLTPTRPEKFEIDGLVSRSGQARLLAANVKVADGSSAFVPTAKDQRDGTLGGIYSRSVRGIVPQVVPVPITFDYAKATFTPIGEQAAQELAQALKEQSPARIQLVGHTDVRGSEDTNMKLSAARAEAVAAFLKQAGVTATIETKGVGASEPLNIMDSSGLSQDDIYALNRRVEFIRQ
ncbi:outer membrane protein OmpA-like peptidoglycan-associated protein [Bradyrhizobium sp. GM22.5]